LLAIADSVATSPAAVVADLGRRRVYMSEWPGGIKEKDVHDYFGWFGSVSRFKSYGGPWSSAGSVHLIVTFVTVEAAEACVCYDHSHARKSFIAIFAEHR
jgi:hypothetical protein